MAGFKEQLKTSVQLRLSVALSLAIVLVTIIAGVFSFMSAFNEANELQDDVLRQIAALFDRQHRPLAHPGDKGRSPDSDDTSRVIVQYLTDHPQTTANTPLPLPATLADGLHTLSIHGEPFRVLIKTMASKERVAIAQKTAIRDDIARDSALRTIMPLLILLPILLWLIADLVRKMFRPIAALATEIDNRSQHALHPVAATPLPVEIRPFAVAINRLLQRVAQAMASQRRFVADAAHELRSPLTALSLQAERLAEADMSSLARERLQTLQQGIARNRNLLDQLLTLAKAQNSTATPATMLAVQSLFRRVLADLLPLASARQIDIGIEGHQEVHLALHEQDLIAIIRNLVDNAIRYTPPGGRVDLSIRIEDGQAILQVKDSGPGIALAERQRVFDPFYRTLGSDQIGSGLGLSIVKAIAERIGAQIRLDFADEKQQSGLQVSILLPMDKPCPTSSAATQQTPPFHPDP